MNKQPSIDVLFASHLHVLAGGGEKSLLEHVIATRDAGYRVHVLVGATGEFSKALEESHVPYSIVFMPWWVRGPGDNTPYVYSSGDPRYNCLTEIILLIQELRPRLCVTNTMVMPWLAYASAITATRHAWFIHEIGTKGLGLSYDLGEKQTLKTISALSDCIFYNSHTTADAYRSAIPKSLFGGVIYPVGSLNNTTHGKTKKSFSKDASLKLVSVGQIKPQKRQLEIVEAVIKLNELGISAEVILVGGFEDSAYVAKIRDAAESAGLSQRVVMTGSVSNPYPYVDQADISVISAVDEAFGRVTVEAMQVGKPVIGAASGGTKEIIKDGTTGLLYQPGNVDELVSKLSLLSNDIELRTSLANNGHNFAKETFSDEHRFSQFFAYLDSLTNSPQRSLDLSPIMPLVDDYLTLSRKESGQRRRATVLQRIRSKAPSKVKRTIRKVIKSRRS